MCPDLCQGLGQGLGRAAQGRPKALNSPFLTQANLQALPTALLPFLMKTPQWSLDKCLRPCVSRPAACPWGHLTAGNKGELGLTLPEPPGNRGRPTPF